LARKAKDPVESVELTISIKADKATAERIKGLVPSAKVRSGTCEMKLAGEHPADLAQRAEELMEKLREVIGSPKDFKNAEGSQSKK
jgi:hypothetical protein